MHKLTLLKPLWGMAHLMRKVGLSPLVDALGRKADRHLGGITLTVDEMTIYCETAGHVHYMRDTIDNDRDRYFRELLRQALEPGDTVVEAGAHLGLVTIEAARCVGPGGHVHAFEPNPETLPVLERNLANNGVTARVTTYPVAASDTSGTHRFFLAGGGESSSLHNPGSSHGSTEVQVVVADDVLPPDLTPSVIKLDTEGNEVSALRGMARTLAHATPRLTVFAECNHGMLKAAGSSTKELIDLLRGYGLEIEWIDDERKICRPISDAIFDHDYVNLIARRV